VTVHGFHLSKGCGQGFLSKWTGLAGKFHQGRDPLVLFINLSSILFIGPSTKKMFNYFLLKKKRIKKLA
jgi:hypothetical protein